ncbi:CBR1 [Cervus elaphus hippelaphus]|uniref:CBR1 n=1 Tax=Cervus elaphus hippelaphus TaxID=46360 RepID=A0A212CIL8_CEREH|nr:CBR1 [Cervus elaphus hippelaphus]
MSSTRVALVTGANKGLGFAITRDLCRRFPGDVVLTARDEARGGGPEPPFHQLDITDLQSIRAVRDFLRKEYGGLDVLVNNAGIAFPFGDPTPIAIQAEVTMKTNFLGTRDVCTELLPLIKSQDISDSAENTLEGPSVLCHESLKEGPSCTQGIDEKLPAAQDHVWLPKAPRALHHIPNAQKLHVVQTPLLSWLPVTSHL